MLPHYSPMKVAETFGMLTGLYPGRIDLGIGRAAGTSPRVAAMLQRDPRQPPPDDFREQLDELLGYFRSEQRAPSTLPQLPVISMWLSAPEPWLLGSSSQSAMWAAELGLPYVFADFINPSGASSAAYYRQHFRASEWSNVPRMAVAVSAICADTDDQARELALSLRMMMTLLFRGRLIPVPTVERARRFLDEEAVARELLPTGRRIITGAPPEVRRKIEGVAAEYGAEEVLIVNIMHDHRARLRSYELLAHEFQLS